MISSRKVRFYTLSFLKHDFKAGLTVFFVALPLCLGVALASGAPLYSGLVAGIIGGIVVSLISKSELSVSGPAAGLTAICISAISDLGSLELFFTAVSIAGILQLIIGLLKLGEFTHFIPSSVIKGMLTAIGIILVSKQIPLLLGYDEPDFWTNELFNIISFRHGFSNLKDFSQKISIGAPLIAILSFVVLYSWKKYVAKYVAVIPASFVTVLSGAIIAFFMTLYFPGISLSVKQFVQVPENVFAQVRFPDFAAALTNVMVWKYAGIIAFVASLETLLSVEAIDKLDPYNRITPQNRELVAQGIGNFMSGFVGGIPITAVIVRSSANAEAGAKTRLSAFSHGIWLLLVVLLAVPVVNLIPYCVLAVLLIRTGYNLAKPSMIKAVYKQGNEQFYPFIVTVIAILFTDLLIGVIIGVVHALFYLVKHTYRAGFTWHEINEEHHKYFKIELALNVSFLNKKKLRDALDKIPAYSVVELSGGDSVYIDNDVLEIIHDFKHKARQKHISLTLSGVPDVITLALDDHH